MSIKCEAKREFTLTLTLDEGYAKFLHAVMHGPLSLDEDQETEDRRAEIFNALDNALRGC